MLPSKKTLILITNSNPKFAMNVDILSERVTMLFSEQQIKNLYLIYITANKL